ncbi:MAG: TAXI family TRAP transporter solute-binding subunit [Candidatus Omnitrophota bacterium]
MKKRMIMMITAVSLFIFVGLSLSGLSPALAAETQRLSLGTAGTTGVYYLYGGALANIISKYVPDLQITAEATGGSVENIKLIGKKEIAIATVAADVVNDAFYDFKKSKHFKEKIELRALFNMYTQPIHIVTLENSSVKNIQDMKGKRVVVGSPGSGTEVKTRALLKILGLEYNRDFTPEFLSFAEGAEALQDRTVDAFFLSVASPAPALISLALTNSIRLIPLSDDEVDKIQKAYPFLTRTIIPGKTYKGVDKDSQTVSVQSLVVCRSDLPDDMVYNIVKTVFEHKKELEQIHNSFKETTLELATPTIAPVHPGAIKYFKEMKVYKEK